MAKFELKFYDHIDNTTIKVDAIIDKDLIQITMKDDDGICIIDLDKSTAIKFAKTLRTEINKITESEATNV